MYYIIGNVNQIVIVDIGGKFMYFGFKGIEVKLYQCLWIMFDGFVECQNVVDVGIIISMMWGDSLQMGDWIWFIVIG